MRPTLNITSFSMIQAASDSGNAAALVFFLLDLLYLDGEDLCMRPLTERKARLAALLSDARSPLHYHHQIGHGRAFHEKGLRDAMPAGPAPASGGRNWSGCGAACSRSPQTGCRSRCRRRATASWGRRWCSAACIGCGPSSSPKSNISHGRTTTCCGKWFMKAYARTNRRPMCGVRCPIPGQPRRRDVN